MANGDSIKVDGWHLDKRISFGHILTTLTLVVSFVIWMTRMESQVAEVRQLTIANAERIVRIEQEQDSQYAEIIRRLERLDERLAAHMTQIGTNHDTR